MYRRQRSGSSSSILTFVVLGILLGIGFLLYQQWRSPAPAAPPALTHTPLPLPTLTPPLLAGEVGRGSTATPMPRANLLLPTAGVSASVVEIYLDGESWDVRYLGSNAGHLQGTAWFGEPGNVVLAGHVEMADGRPGIFAGIDMLNVGDPAILSLGDAQQRYAITAIKKVAPDDLSVLYPAQTDRLTLITCDSYNFLQNEYQDRLVIVADRTA
jgi:LPXTG-site transpeptidase (sortase) family protein